MLKQLEIIGKITNGRLSKPKSLEIAEYLRSLEGKNAVITISKLSSKRSLQQNRYLHLIFTIFKDGLNELGNEFTMQEVKDICKYKFALMDVVNESTSEIIGQRIKGTSEMSKVELAEFIDNVIRWAADNFHIVLPVPNEMLEINFVD